MRRIRIVSIILFAITAGIPYLNGDDASSKKSDSASQGSLNLKTLCTPVMTARQWTWATVRNSAGKWRYITTFFNYGYGKKSPAPEWLLVDLETGKQQTFVFPGYANTRYTGDKNIVAPNGRMFFGASGCRVNYYDPETDTIKTLGKIFPDDKMYKIFYSMVLGPDNLLYCGTQSSNGQVAIVQINPETLKINRFKNVANVTRKEGLTYAYYIAVDPPWVYVAAGKGRWRLLALNTQTGEGKVLADNCTFISFGISPTGVLAKLNSKTTKMDLEKPKVANITINKKTKNRKVWCYDGKVYPAVDYDKSYPGPKTKERFPAFFAKNKTKVVPPRVDASSPDQNGTIKISVSSKGGNRKSFSAKTTNITGIGIESLTYISKDVLFGNCRQYRGFFRYDAQTGKTTYYGKHGPSGPRYAHANDKIYFTGYPTAGLYVYDPKRPWRTKDTVPRVPPRKYNPKFIDYLGISSGAHYSYFLIPAKNGRLYFGGRLERGHTGSGVAYYDTKTKKIVGHHRNLNFIKPRGLVVLEPLNRIILSGSLQGDPNSTAKKPKEAQLVFFDLDLNEIERMSPRDGLLATGHLYPLPGNKNILGNIKDPNAQAALYRYNVETKQLELWKELKTPVDQVVIRKSDDTYWVTQGTLLGRLNIDTLEITPVGTIQGPAKHLLWNNNQLYGVAGANLVKIDIENKK